jgi:hypothetical protein
LRKVEMAGVMSGRINRELESEGRGEFKTVPNNKVDSQVGCTLTGC